MADCTFETARKLKSPSGMAPANGWFEGVANVAWKRFEDMRENELAATPGATDTSTRLVRRFSATWTWKVRLVTGSLDARLKCSRLLLPGETLVELTLTMVGIGMGTTITVKDWVALMLGLPLSETTTEIRLVVPPWADVGRQPSRPVTGSSDRFFGAPSARLKVSVCGGRSLSVAELVIQRRWPALIVRSAIGASTGAVFGGAPVTTTTAKVFESLELVPAPS